MFDVMIYTDPSCKAEFGTKIGEVNSKEEITVFLNGYVKGKFDEKCEAGGYNV